MRFALCAAVLRSVDMSESHQLSAYTLLLPAFSLG